MFEVFAPIGSHMHMKIGKYIFFSKIPKTKERKKSRDMAQGKQQLKSERNPCNTFRDNRCHRRTDGRRMDAGRISIS